MSPTSYITRHQLATMLGTSHATVDRMVRRAELPQPFRFSDRVLRFDLGEIQAWIEAQRQKPQPLKEAKQ